MKKICFTLLCIATFVGAQAQNYAKKLKKAQGIEVVYQTVYKDEVRPNDGKVMSITGDEMRLSAATPAADNDTDGTLIQNSYIDYSRRCSYRWAQLPNGEKVYSVTPFEYGEGFTEVGEDTYLGLRCKIVRTILRSNTIDVWYTNDLAFRGTPQAGVGVPDGLVLRVIRNKDMIQQATELRAIKNPVSLLPTDWGHMLDEANYQYAINNSYVISVPVFDNEGIGFNGAKLEGDMSDEIVYRAAGGTVILKKVKLPDNVDDRSIFVEVVQHSIGDAYDRTGSVFVIPEGKQLSFINALKDLNSVPAFTSGGKSYPSIISTPDYDVPVELMRFFTGFGVRHYNSVKVPGQEWSDSVLYKTEVTSLAEQLTGEKWIGAYIGNWDKNGHKVSVKLKYYPNDKGKINHVLPLFNTVNYMEQAGQEYPAFLRDDVLKVKFTLKEDVKDARLYYITTGHGGWGRGDEFNQKVNTIYVDGNKVISFIPWRDDCGTYRNWNPCSGNFSNGLSSSDLSRSNWCPGTVTNPEYIYVGDLKAGDHTVTVQIPQGAPEGASLSYWCVSGMLIY